MCNPFPNFEIQPLSFLLGGGSCPGFLCHKNKYCISSTLKCNGEANCGKGDNSDESAECKLLFFICQDHTLDS